MATKPPTDLQRELLEYLTALDGSTLREIEWDLGWDGRRTLCVVRACFQRGWLTGGGAMTAVYAVNRVYITDDGRTAVSRT